MATEKSYCQFSPLEQRLFFGLGTLEVEDNWSWSNYIS